jgi:predicted RNase H-like nuclease (RuvC/YqgF family)
MSTLKLSAVLVMGLLSLAAFAGCSRTSEQKVADAKADVVVAKQDVKDAVADAKTEARQEWLAFKSEAEARMTTAGGKLHADYDKKIDALEQKNKELKVKLSEYKDSGKNAWEQFKSEFSHDMDALGAALKDFTVDNKK